MFRLLRFVLPVLLLPLGIAHAGGTINVSFDIKPTSCPNPFNPLSLDFQTETVPTAILGTVEMPSSTLQPNSLVLVVPGGGGVLPTYVYPIQTGFEDVATPVEDTSNCQCTTEGPDGFIDLTAKFDADDIAAALGGVYGGQYIQLCIEALTLDNELVRGCDCIVIVGPVSAEDDSWGRTKASYR